MSKKHLIITISVLFLVIFFGLSFIEIPAPSKEIKEIYKIEIK
jgi:hypothetical protein